MLKKGVLALFLLVFIFWPILNANANGIDHESKAKAFLKAKMINRAIEEFELEIDANPTNAEAHFQLASLYLNQGADDKAGARFASANSLDPQKYGQKTAAAYFEAGNLNLNRPPITRAFNYYQQSLRYDQKHRLSIVENCLNKALTLFDPGRPSSDDAELLLNIAIRHDPGLKDKIETARKQYGQQCLQTAKLKTKEQRDPYLKEAGKYLKPEEIQQILPPPTWKTVFEKTYTGIGFSGGVANDGGIYIVRNGVDCKYGDKITIVGNNFQFWYEGGWKKFNEGKFVTINKSNKDGECFGARAPKGEEIKVTVERLL